MLTAAAIVEGVFWRNRGRGIGGRRLLASGGRGCAGTIGGSSSRKVCRASSSTTVTTAVAERQERARSCGRYQHPRMEGPVARGWAALCNQAQRLCGGPKVLDCVARSPTGGSITSSLTSCRFGASACGRDGRRPPPGMWIRGVVLLLPQPSVFPSRLALVETEAPPRRAPSWSIDVRAGSPYAATRDTVVVNVRTR